MIDYQALDLSNPSAATDALSVERFNRREERLGNLEGDGARSGPVALIRHFCSDVSVILEQRIADINHLLVSSQPFWRLKGFAYLARALDPDVLAAATLHAMLTTIVRGQPLTVTNLVVGQAAQGECWAARLLNSNKGLAAKAAKKAEKFGTITGRRNAAKRTAAQVGWRTADWGREELLLVGSFLTDCVIEAAPSAFEIIDVPVEGEVYDQKYLQVTAEGAALVHRAQEEALQRAGVFTPCLMPPKPWTGFREGGYWDGRSRFSSPLIRTPDKSVVAAIKAAMKDGSAAPHVNAVNALQSVAWCINKPILDLVRYCWEHDVKIAKKDKRTGETKLIPVPGLPPQTDIPVPERMTDEEWQSADKKARHRRIHEREEAEEHNRGLRCDRLLLAQDLGFATKLVSEREFFTPTNCDWRGRVYSVSHFNFSRDDRVRAMFLFARGMPIGTEGLYWLKIHLANCGDFNKVSKRPFEERIQWVDDNLMKIAETAADPLHPRALEFWSQADCPFLFVAACQEYAAALREGPTFLTRLPVSWDGSCSGLQHLCAMTRSPEGELVNLTNGDIPQDIYQTVADLVKKRIEADLNAPSETVKHKDGTEHIRDIPRIARLCLDYGIDRTLVKRNVMTFAYSSKPFGMAGQHKEDLMRKLAVSVLKGERKEHPFGDKRLQGEIAMYLARRVYDAIKTVVNGPADAMAFLQQIARALAHEGKPATWVTPMGLPWRNAYFTKTYKTVRVWMASRSIQLRLGDGYAKTIEKSEAANGIAPNFVHALDAAHLLRVVNACAAEGIDNIATVHDSFGCLAPQAGRFNQIIREQFVSMYEEHDVLAEILEAAKRDLTPANHHRLPQLPAKGSLNLKEVLNAKFCFA